MKTGFIGLKNTLGRLRNILRPSFRQATLSIEDIKTIFKMGPWGKRNRDDNVIEPATYIKPTLIVGEYEHLKQILERVGLEPFNAMSPDGKSAIVLKAEGAHEKMQRYAITAFMDIVDVGKWMTENVVGFQQSGQGAQRNETMVIAHEMNINVADERIIAGALNYLQIGFRLENKARTLIIKTPDDLEKLKNLIAQAKENPLPLAPQEQSSGVKLPEL